MRPRKLPRPADSSELESPRRATRPASHTDFLTHPTVQAEPRGWRRRCHDAGMGLCEIGDNGSNLPCGATFDFRLNIDSSILAFRSRRHDWGVAVVCQAPVPPQGSGHRLGTAHALQRRPIASSLGHLAPIEFKQLRQTVQDHPARAIPRECVIPGNVLRSTGTGRSQHPGSPNVAAYSGGEPCLFYTV